jgi:hypothetical protein
VETSQPTVSRVRKQYIEEGMEAAINRRPPKREYHRKLDGEQEVRLVALACRNHPKAGFDGACAYLPTSWWSSRS